MAIASSNGEPSAGLGFFGLNGQKTNNSNATANRAHSTAYPFHCPLVGWFMSLVIKLDGAALALYLWIGETLVALKTVAYGNTLAINGAYRMV